VFDDLQPVTAGTRQVRLPVQTPCAGRWVPQAAVVGLILILFTVTAAAGGIGLATRGKMLEFVVAALAGIALTALFVRFFWTGLLIIFTVRASLDHLKSGGAGSGALSPASVIGGLLLLSGAVWLYRRKKEERMYPLSPLAVALLLLAGACVFTSATSLHPFASFNSSLRIVSSALMLVLLEQLFRDRPSRIWAMLVAVFASILGPGLVALSQLIGNKPVIPAYGPPLAVGRVEGTFVHPNAFATYLVLVLPLAVAILPRVRGWWTRLAVWAVIGGSGALLLFTYARAAWIAAIVALLVVGFLQDRRIVAIVLGGAAIALLAVPSITARLSDLLKSHPYATNADPNSLSWRFGYWAKVLPLVRHSPVTGIGLDMVQRIEPAGLPPHDVYVQALVESGAIGLLATLNAVVASIRSFRGALRRKYDPWGRSLLVGAIAAGVGFLIQTITENLYTQAVSQWYVLVPVAWALAVRTTDSHTWDDTFSRRRNQRPPALLMNPEDHSVPLGDRRGLLA
jgi:putative inorganic carbon (HCO3(-)) transporter